MNRPIVSQVGLRLGSGGAAVPSPQAGRGSFPEGGPKRFKAGPASRVYGFFFVVCVPSHV